MSTQKYTRKDFLSSTDPRWCLGCGNYAAFNALTRVFANSGKRRESFALISGIGCSSRLPYYSNTYGFHTIHGRAPAVAMGLLLAKPELNVWVITGDGDGLSIGGNHFLHLMRRNPNIKVVLFNNRVYGLTKGQTSPTSPLGAKTKSTPFGNIDRPIHPLTVALGAGATFVARAPDNDNDLLYSVLERAEKHVGVAVVEVLTNCIIFNDGTFAPATSPQTRDEHSVRLEEGKPLLFGKERNKGISIRGCRPEIISCSEADYKSQGVLVHELASPNLSYAFMLAEMGGDGFPLPLGILRQAEEHVYEGHAQAPTKQKLELIFRSGAVWNRKEDGSVQDVSASKGE